MSRSKIYGISRHVPCPRQNHLVRVQDLQDLTTKQKFRIQVLRDPTAKQKIKIQDLQDPKIKQNLGSRIREIQDLRDLKEEQTLKINDYGLRSFYVTDKS